MKYIKHQPGMDIRNLSGIRKLKGARYLEVIQGQGSEYIAKRWRKCLVSNPGVILLDFGR